MRGTQRLLWFKRNLCDVIEEFNPHHIVIEGYAYAKGQGAHQIGELGGVIRLAMHEIDADYTEIAPAKLKKFITGKGNAKKEIVMVELYKRFKVEVPTTDEADAAVLAIMGAVGGGGMEVDLPKLNMDVLEGIVFS
jgi:crossover junction endodeoxyribonuclease RuvC